MGIGGVDVIPHQIVRTQADRVYIFTLIENSSTLRVYSTTVAGLPNSAADFGGATTWTESELPISMDAVYDGGHIIHVLVNTKAGKLKDYPFNTNTNSFASAFTLATSSPVPTTTNYIGTMGVSGMIDTSGVLHIAYWSGSLANQHITHVAYTYNSATNTLTTVSAATQVDAASNANHPMLAVSPLDNSVTIAWVSEATSPRKILARTRNITGTWGSVETVSTADVWTSPYFGISVDQGPNMLISPDGKKHLIYLQNFDPSDYGHLHYVVFDGTSWNDQALSSYTHAAALARNTAGEMYIIGHGHPRNASCTDMTDLCTIKKNSNGTWASPQVFITHSTDYHFDTSVSMKWSVVGYNRPETIEFLTFDVKMMSGYDTARVYYARLATP